ncbi:unnamed protein product [Rotaria magnacalcarata]|uniref:RING-type domain-containing protein n=2 Tax=Rotaria magnacalcarata TaxID=392030 RepID=A0A820CF32_9BILA|nr:unnamed protein product [Rotaria magnacalcarata]CAF4220363.1 unnamed protein product [Rotaria magnacalcarata]
MIEAGFFNCNVGDRVICLYCNIICQQWTPNTDNPVEIHKTLSPKCPYVLAILDRQQLSAIRVMNDQFTRDNLTGTMNVDTLRCGDIVNTIACHQNYMEIPRRYTSFATFPTENLPSVENLVKAGFFYTGSKTIVTCFYCNGSLQNWGANDNPMIEHARWFPHCGYAKQLCGAELYRKIQESKRAQQEKVCINESTKLCENEGSSNSKGQLTIPDESTLSRLVAARLDLPISQYILKLKFKLSIIKRCWEDQLKFKHEDFLDECDLFVACIILLKQIEKIDGKKENIIVPSVKMNQIRDLTQAEMHTRAQVACAATLTDSLNHTDDNKSTFSESVVGETTSKTMSVKTKEKQDTKAEKVVSPGKNPVNVSSSSQACVLCLEEERSLACLPCGHLATCVPCGHSLRSCPICRTAINSYVRIYT